MLHSWAAADDHSGLNIAGNAALGGYDGAVSDLTVTYNAGLASQDRPVADLRRTSESDLSSQQRVFCDVGTVTNLNQVVYFCAAIDAGCADAGAIDAGVGLDFDVVADDDRLRLRNFVPAPGFVFGEAKSVGSNDHAVLQKDVVAKFAALTDYGMSMGEKVVTDLYIAVDDDMSEEHCVFTNLNILADDCVRTDMRSGADLG